jgi:hypothetical protein
MSGMPQSRLKTGDATPGTWSWLKEWSGYIVTVLPYLSSMLVLVPGLSLGIKVAILVTFTLFVLTVRVLHEKASLETTGSAQRHKRPGSTASE